ncbi:TldD/PmbA family protein [Heliophilum fasciatum]|uniref:TldD/PmbA family protein n=1 Tax=Heliophilum fasciatum TaxID=35700 RepID=UPI0029F50E7A|nr:TldD/PmbA family protein [Heliophilum fasciatum]MCW2277317.1 PmbA protein [Heliophilum fasciatum]
MSGTVMSDLARRMVAQATQKGAAMAEAYGLHSKELSIEVAQGAVETMKQAEDRGLGLRVFANGRMGYAFTSDLTEGALALTVEQALANATYTAADPYHALPVPVEKYPDVVTFDGSLDATAVEAKIALAKEMEAIAKATDKRIKITERSAYQDAQYHVSIVNSRGIDVAYRGSYCGAYLFLVAEENGESQTGFSFSYGRGFGDLQPQKVGREAAEHAVRMLGAKPLAAKRAPVVFDPRVMTQFLGVLAPTLTAEAVQKGKSMFAGQLTKTVASPLVTLIDDGRLPEGIASAPFDGEGVPTSRTVLMDQGVLQTYLYNSYTAAKDRTASTGNGVRGSFKGTPEVGTTNFFLDAGTLTPEALIGDVEDGIYVTEVMGMHTANPISGDFSVGAAGLCIEKGVLARPFRGAAIAGNLHELLMAIDGVGADLTFFGGKGAPTVRIREMAISG